MRTLLSLILAVVVLGLGAWAYRENYATQSAMAAVEDLQRQIAAQRARLAVLRAEWAYLNRPDRLNDLAEINFDRLGLLPLAPEQFGLIDEIAFPPVSAPPPEMPASGLTGVVDVTGPVPSTAQDATKDTAQDRDMP